MSYNNNWTKELKEAYLEEKKAIQVVKKTIQKGAEVVKQVGGKVVKALGTPANSDTRSGLGKGGVFVEHRTNDLQEQIALNEHLLSLIEALCEELGIDVDELLSEDFTTPERDDRLTGQVLAAVARGDHARAQELVARLDAENADTENVYGEDGRKVRSSKKLAAAGFHRVPGTKKRKKR
jgi:hypothetical protein